MVGVASFAVRVFCGLWLASKRLRCSYACTTESVASSDVGGSGAWAGVRS